MSMSPAAIREAYSLQQQAKQLASKSVITRSDQKKVDALLAQISNIKQVGLSTDEIRQNLADQYGREIGVDQQAHEKLFRDFLRGTHDTELEQRASTFVSGQQTPIFSAGLQGGVLVPIKFQQNVTEGLAATDPLLDENVVGLVQEPSFTLPPLTVPGFDLSSIAAVKVGETSQQNAQTIPVIDSKMLNRYTYRVSLAASIEFEEDSKAYGSAENAMARAFGIAFARGIGADLVNGDGSTTPQGIVTGAADSGVTTVNAGKVVLGDFTNVFYSVNKAYRESDRAAWLVNDGVAKMISNAVDDQHRPLFPVVDGVTRILGKPVYVTPSLPAYNASLGTQAAGSFCVFGDLSHYVVHASTMYMRRRINTPGFIEYGKTLYTGLLMVDAVVHDPTDGALPPVVTARLHS
jgi:HK97 family phage major capsid protein